MPACWHFEEIPMAAITNCHNLSGLKQLDLLFYSSRGPKSEMGLMGAKIKVSVGLVPSGGSKGEPILCLFQLP